ncbi:hypothetical protein K466DRAFT_122382 [Polyporus arcularius HHB13444]|uniref:Uncharacterized protein n=1 Tax=Polyporus arcularius HHB13444 TaxID=1314778 RepID=A0A5C3PUD5_9APHY|nr:hypothetical protein K466DRAFT_122382 [Polyporus arcularius HHB13444]
MPILVPPASGHSLAHVRRRTLALTPAWTAHAIVRALLRREFGLHCSGLRSIRVRTRTRELHLTGSAWKVGSGSSRRWSSKSCYEHMEVPGMHNAL